MRGIPTVPVDPLNPDDLTVAAGFGCRTACPDGFAAFEATLAAAFVADRPTVIELREEAGFLG